MTTASNIFYRNLAQSGIELDFTFVVEEKELGVFKMLLIAHCGYFKQMFENEWKETKTNRMEIKNFSYDVMAKFVELMFTPHVHISSVDMALGLLKAANYFQVKHIASSVQYFFDQNSTGANTIDITDTSVANDSFTFANYTGAPVVSVNGTGHVQVALSDGSTIVFTNLTDPNAVTGRLAP